MASQNKKPERCTPGIAWLDTAIAGGRTFEEVAKAQVEARVAAEKRAQRDLLKCVTLEFWSGMCFYCGELCESNWTWEHFIPKSHDGSDSVANCLPACSVCNSDRRSTDPWEYMKNKGASAEFIAARKSKLREWQGLCTEGNSATEEERAAAWRWSLANGVFDSAVQKYGYGCSSVVIRTENEG